MKIITVFDEDHEILHKKASAIAIDTEEGKKEAKYIADKLFETAEPIMPIAGLAAEQIGFDKQVFIYSYNRGAKDSFDIVINPTIIWKSDDILSSWEGCLSAVDGFGGNKAAKVPRAKTIIAQYYGVDGKLFTKKMTGYVAKVFQHEYDHLQGVVNTERHDSQVQYFPNHQEFVEFMREVRLQEAMTYDKPIDIDLNLIEEMAKTIDTE